MLVWFFGLNVLEVIGLMCVMGLLSLTALFAGWLVLVTGEGRKRQRRVEEQDRNEEWAAERLRLELWQADQEAIRLLIESTKPKEEAA